MSRFKTLDGDKTSIELHKFEVIKELCARRKISVKEYINSLIHKDMMRADEDLSIKYFKEN